MARVALTKKMAEELLHARERASKSQYEIADELGWVRSKIKRIEKAEIKTIDEADLKQLAQLLGVKDLSTKRLSSKKRSTSSGAKVISLFKVKGLFTKVRHLPLRSLAGGKNVLFFEVTMAKDMTAEQLLEVRKVDLLGVTGSINGVENTQDQNPIRAGDRVSIMLWGMGIGEGVQDLNDAARRARR